jgi:hypothetical protein
VEPPVHLDLLIEPGSSPIAGWLNVAGASPLAFSGYLELLALLERVVGGEAAGEAQALGDS